MGRNTSATLALVSLVMNSHSGRQKIRDVSYTFETSADCLEAMAGRTAFGHKYNGSDRHLVVLMLSVRHFITPNISKNVHWKALHGWPAVRPCV